MKTITAKLLGRSWRRRLVGAGVAYAVVVALLALFQDRFFYHPAGAASWRESRVASTQDVVLKSRDGNSIHARWYPFDGSNRALLYSHGNAGNLSHRDGVCLEFATKLKMPVMVYDYPGYGRSSGSPSEEGCYAAADAAWRWLTETRGIPAKNIVLLGKSLGGAMATDLAYQHDCRALVLVRSFTSMPDVAADKMPLIPARWLTRPQFDNRAKLPKCRCPVFVHHGRNDTLIHCGHGECLHQIATGPAELLIDETGHHGSGLPADFYTRLNAFLSQRPVD